MRRAVLAVVAAAFGAGAVVGLAPRSGGPHIIASGNTVPATPSSSATSSPSASPSRSKHRTWPAKSHASSSPTPRSAAPRSSATPSATQAPAQTNRTITGPEVSNGWGPIQVTVTLNGSTITAVDVPVTPQDGRSQFINSRAVPILTQEAVQAQSAQVDAVSGATDTSDAFMQSLAAALKQAG